MKLSHNLEWLPLYVHKLRASDRYKAMKDYQQAWYLNLLFASWDSPTPGYLADDGQLWRLANALDGPFFLKRAGPVMACFERTTIDGRPHLFNRRLLKIVQEQLKVIENKQSRKQIPSSLLLFSSCVFQIYDEYPRKEGRGKALIEIQRAIERLAKEKHWEETHAAAFIYDAVKEFKQSDAAQAIDPKSGRSLCPHPSTWFHQDRFLDDREQWKVKQPPGKFADLDKLYADEK